jgi:hypothetical protein
MLDLHIRSTRILFTDMLFALRSIRYDDNKITHHAEQQQAPTGTGHR